MWITTLSSAQRQQYDDALRSLQTIITTFPQFAKKYELDTYKSQWEQTIAAGQIWIHAERLAEQFNFAEAVTAAEKLLEEYPACHYSGQARARLLQWKKIISMNQQVNALNQQVIAIDQQFINITKETNAAKTQMDIQLKDFEKKQVKYSKSQAVFFET